MSDTTACSACATASDGSGKNEHDAYLPFAAAPPPVVVGSKQTPLTH